MQNIWLAFVTGLTTGGISCLAVQGGLLTTSIAQKETDDEVKLGKVAKISSFLLGKLLSYTLLGFALGLLGSSLVLTPNLLGWTQIFAGVFMLGTALRLLDIHPYFRYFQITPPKFLYKILRENSKKSSGIHKGLFAPGLLGFLTILVPCGVTQAMMALAVASGNPFFGAGIMFAFTLGTSPIFFTLGTVAMALLKQRWFNYAAAGLVAILGVLSINTGQVLRASPHTIENYWKALTDTPVQSQKIAGVNQGVQEVTIDVKSSGYLSTSNTLKVGVPVRLTLKTQGTQGCSRAFTIPGYNISKVLPQTGTETVEFTPTKTGNLTYTCSMGMYTGQFTVIN